MFVLSIKIFKIQMYIIQYLNIKQHNVVHLLKYTLFYLNS